MVETKMKSLLVVIPVHNEEQIVANTVSSILVEVEKIDVDVYITLVDDGSLDQSWQSLQWLAKTHPDSVNVLKLSRRYGKDAAILAGLNSQECGMYLVIDADGEHPVSMIHKMYEALVSENNDVVHGVKNSRRSNLAYRFISKTFNKVFSLSTGINITESSDFKIFTKRFRDALLEYQDCNYFFRGVSSIIGFKSAKILFNECESTKKKSSWNLKGLIKYAINSIIGFTYLPLYIILSLGLLSVLMSIILGSKVLYEYILGTVPTGYATIIILLLMSLGIIMSSIGIVGVYVSRIFNEVKGRPRYIISEEIKNKHV